MTVHKAKGLEFPVVFLVGMMENILPSKKGNLEEERRICFVGISRAMKLLYLSWSMTYLGQPSKKSIFLYEILDTKNQTYQNNPLKPSDCFLSTRSVSHVYPDIARTTSTYLERKHETKFQRKL